MGVSLTNICKYLPEQKITNQELSNLFPSWTAESIEEVTGIKYRHIADQSETPSDLAFFAAKKLIKEEGLDPNQIDTLLFCTQSVDYICPTTACILQKRLELKTSTAALDFNLGCTGYVYGLAIAKGFLETGMSKGVLLLTAETISRYLAPNDASTRMIFGDGASASFIQRKDDTKGLGNFVFGTDGSGFEDIIIQNGRAKHNWGEESLINSEDQSNASGDHFLMKGANVLAFTLKRVPEMIYELLEKEKLSIADVDLFVFHQANLYVLKALQRKMKIPQEKMVFALQETGNTVSSTIPIALIKARENNQLKSNQKVLLASFGVGLSWAATIINT